MSKRRSNKIIADLLTSRQFTSMQIRLTNYDETARYHALYNLLMLIKQRDLENGTE